MSWSQEELVAAAYAVVFVFVLVYVAIIAAKLARLQRETAELVELAARKGATTREPPDSRLCCDRARATAARSGSDGVRPDPPTRHEAVRRGAAAPRSPVRSVANDEAHLAPRLRGALRSAACSSRS